MLRPKLSRLWANSNAIFRRDPGDAKYISGWTAEIPTYQVLNYLQWKSDATMLALAERGVFEWGNDVSYKKNATVWDETDGTVYVALVENPSTSTVPSKNSTQWARSSVGITRKEYDAIVSDIDAHIANKNNPHGLTPAKLGTYTIAQIDALAATYRNEVNNHASRKDNPHELTAVGVGGVASTGGVYTGDVRMGTGKILLSSDGSVKVQGDPSGNVWLANSRGSVGVASDGTGYVQAGNGAKETIVTRDTFAANKERFESAYAVPLPDFQALLTKDFNIYVGEGVGECLTKGGADASPKFTDFGYLYEGKNPSDINNQVALKYSKNPLSNSVEGTVALDLKYSSTTASDGFVLVLGERAAGQFVLASSNSGAKSITFSRRKGAVLHRSDAVQVASESRLVATYNSSTLKVYLNGVLVTSRALDNTSSIGASNDFTLGWETLTNALQMEFRNIRVWRKELTDKQVSTL